MRRPSLVLMGALFALDARAQGTRADYVRAEQFLAPNARKLVFTTSVAPNWLERSERFWYRREQRAGKAFLILDAANGSVAPIFDHARLAAALGRATGKPYVAERLPFDSIEVVDAGRAVEAEAELAVWRCDLAAYECAKSSRRAEGDLRSPDGRWIAFVRSHDLFVRSAATGEETRLTSDGETAYAYATPASPSSGGITNILTRRPARVAATWSPDSKKLLTHRLDERRVREHHVVQATFPESMRPRPIAYRYTLPGDAEAPMAELLIADVEQRKMVKIQAPPLLTFGTPIGSTAWWSADGSHVYFVSEDRAFTGARLYEADAVAGQARQILEEKAKTYLQLSLEGPPNVKLLERSGDVLWFSERDGWGHLYLYDKAGALKRQLTKGDWVVRELLHVDEAKGLVYFTAGGREPGRDPYYRHLYRVRLDGSALELLTSEDADHDISISPSGRFVVDTFSRVDLAPVSVLRSADGKVLRPIEKADVELLLRTGWKWPERFSFKARDGTTDVYGIVYRPTTFDASKKYPVIDDIYPGPHNIRTPKTFDRALTGHAQSVAELGFVVVTIDGMGTCCRSKSFHDVSYKNLGDAGLPEHLIGIRTLASRYPYLDLERVGIYGHSAGGYASAHAILQYPDFYKVAVSSAGNHDHRTDKAVWVERWMGLPVADHYREQANSALAGNLNGKLLLVHGELDDNVHPGSSVQLVDALIKANRTFDFLPLPNRNHGNVIDMSPERPRVIEMDRYFLRRRWDYFVRHLLGVEPPAGYEIADPSKRDVVAGSQ